MSQQVIFMPVVLSQPTTTKMDSQPQEPPVSHFRSRDQVTHQAGRTGLVALQFSNANPAVSLFAHAPYLMACSGVLRGILEDQEDTCEQPAKIARTLSSSDVSGTPFVIPLDDQNTQYWEELLAMLYPATAQQTKITWNNAEGLLLLADKYDMPLITGRVREFMNGSCHFDWESRTQLQLHLTVGNVFEWLRIFSRCRLDDEAQVCINHIIIHDLRIPSGFLTSGVDLKYAEQLLQKLQDNHQHKHKDWATLQNVLRGDISHLEARERDLRLELSQLKIRGKSELEREVSLRQNSVRRIEVLDNRLEQYSEKVKELDEELERKNEQLRELEREVLVKMRGGERCRRCDASWRELRGRLAPMPCCVHCGAPAFQALN